MDEKELERICNARNVLCGFCENKDFCEKCQVTLLVDQAYADYESENEEE